MIHLIEKMGNIFLKIFLEKFIHNLFWRNIKNFGFCDFGSSFWNLKNIFRVSIFWNIKKFRFLKYKEFSGFPFPKIWKSSISWNIRKAFFWENIKNLLILELKSSISWNIRNFLGVDLFKLFSSLGLKVR